MPSIKIVLPGELLELEPQSPGFAHGFGLFETMRLRAGRLELWEAHWKRLIHSARALGIACPFGQDEVLAALPRLIRELPDEAAIKLSLLKEGDTSSLVLYSRLLVSPPERIGLLMEEGTPINERSWLAGHKTHNYLENLLVLEAARKEGCFDGLRLNLRGKVAEGAVSNVFFYRDGCLHTPSLKCGALPGVVRGALVEALPVQQGLYSKADILSAEAVFLTNSLNGLLPVDWLLAAGRKSQLQSRGHACFEQAQTWLDEHVKASAIVF